MFENWRSHPHSSCQKSRDEIVLSGFVKQRVAKSPGLKRNWDLIWEGEYDLIYTLAPFYVLFHALPFNKSTGRVSLEVPATLFCLATSNSSRSSRIASSFLPRVRHY